MGIRGGMATSTGPHGASCCQGFCLASYGGPGKSYSIGPVLLASGIKRTTFQILALFDSSHP